MRRPLRIVISALLIFATGSLATAQVTEDEILRGIAHARQSGAPISDEEVERIMQHFREEQTRFAQMQEELQWQDRGPAPNLSAPVSHIMGKDGIPFPNPEQIVFKPPPTSTPSPLGTPTPHPVWSPEPYTRPTKCERNETVRQEIHSDGDDGVILVDKLFVSEDLVPVDPQEVFGAETLLIPYGPKEDKGTLIRMEIYRVPCVPYRMRTTGKGDYIDTGLNALKNYDANPSGKGVLHPFVEGKLYPEKQPKPRREKPGPKRH